VLAHTRVCLCTLFFGVTSTAIAQPDRISRPIDPASTVPLAGNRSLRAVMEADRGRIDPTTNIDGVMMIFRRSATQQADLDALLADQRNPSSPRYHQWLTSAEFGDRFGLSGADLAKIVDWLVSRGLHISYTAPSRTSLMASGPAAAVERAFGVELHRYLVDGDVRFANASDPSVPAEIAPLLLTIQGLDNIAWPAPRKRASVKPRFTIDPGIYGIVPGDIATIYDVNPFYNAGYFGQGQTIAVMGQSNVSLADIAAFRAYVGLAANTPTALLVPGSSDPGTSNANALEEATLDLEWSGALAPEASVILVYASSIGIAVQYAVESVAAQVMSYSSDVCEPQMNQQEGGQTLESAFRQSIQQANALGITFVAGSGDRGASDCESVLPSEEAPATTGLAVAFPASIPETTAVGGTQFPAATGTSQYWSNLNNPTTLASALGYIPEMVWNYAGIGASGGGSSILYTKPDWQTGFGPSDNARDVPDICFFANDAYFYVLHQSPPPSAFASYTSGTSISTQVFAGMLALVDQYLVASGALPKPGMGNINPTLYSLAKSTPAVFHDIASGNDGVYCEPGSANCTTGVMGYQAIAGFDRASGLGSMDIAEFAVNWVVANPLPLAISAPASLPSGKVGAAYTATTVTASGGSGNYTWSATGLPPGLAIDPKAGTISGTPTSADGSPYAASVQVADGNTSVSRSYSVTIFSRCDFNQTGSTTVADIQTELREALGIATAVNELTGRNTVGVIDVQTVINAALSLGCAAQ